VFHKNGENIEIFFKILIFFGLCSREECLRRSEPFTTQGMPISQLYVKVKTKLKISLNYMHY
jgi:hypothetical protein